MAAAGLADGPASPLLPAAVVMTDSDSAAPSAASGVPISSAAAAKVSGLGAPASTCSVVLGAAAAPAALSREGASAGLNSNLNQR
eukprot:15303766-Heterocapsa_arctica.AAC.1